MHILRTTAVTPESMPNATLSGLLTHVANSRLDGVMSLPYSLPIRIRRPSDHHTPLSWRYAYVQNSELTLIT